AERLGIVVLTNAAPVGVPEAVSESFFDLVLKGKVQKDWLARLRPGFAALATPAYGAAADFSQPPGPERPPLPRAAYRGTYRNDYFGPLEVEEKGEALVLRLGPKRKPFVLRHWDRDVFLYQPKGENAAGPSAVAFWIGPDRKAVRVVVENL